MKLIILQNLLKALVISCLVLVWKVGIAQFKPLKNPVTGNSFTPNFYKSAKGELLMSWQTKDIDQKHALFFSKYVQGNWSVPVKIAQEQATPWFVNWADFPAMTTFGKNSLVVNYLQKSAASTYAYDIWLKTSVNGGKTWNKAFMAHNDGTPTEHGFVSLAPATNHRFLAVWLDGRETAKKKAPGHDAHHHGSSQKAMTLRAAFFDAKGKATQKTVLDKRVCDCCQTSVAKTNDGYIVVYRNRSQEEIRDIGYVTYQNGQWSEPQILYADDWKINGCPVNGPSVSAVGNKVAVAWYTMANNQPKVKVIFSGNGGKTFGQAYQIDEGDPLGRVGVATLPNGDALIVWMETKGDDTLIKLRRMGKQGKKYPSQVISKTSQSRGSGFPKLVVHNGQALIAWTQLQDAKNRKSLKQIKTAIYNVK